MGRNLFHSIAAIHLSAPGLLSTASRAEEPEDAASEEPVEESRQRRRHRERQERKARISAVRNGRAVVIREEDTPS